MKNITVILYWEEKQDRDFHLLLSSRMEVLCVDYDELSILHNDIENVIRKYHDDYYNRKKYYDTEHYWKIYPDSIHVLIDGKPHNVFDSDYADIHIIGDILIEYCHGAIDNYVHLKNSEIDEKIRILAINHSALQVNREIEELKRLQKKYPNVY